MSQHSYTSIPDTSDSNYWQIKPGVDLSRGQVFVPRDKELHQKLKAEAWAKIQAALPIKLRSRVD